MPRFIILRGKIGRDGNVLYPGDTFEMSLEEAGRFPTGMVEEVLPFEVEVPPEILLAEVEEEVQVQSTTGSEYSGVYTSPEPVKPKKGKRAKE